MNKSRLFLSVMGIFLGVTCNAQSFVSEEDNVVYSYTAVKVVGDVKITQYPTVSVAEPVISTGNICTMNVTVSGKEIENGTVREVTLEPKNPYNIALNSEISIFSGKASFSEIPEASTENVKTINIPARNISYKNGEWGFNTSDTESNYWMLANEFIIPSDDASFLTADQLKTYDFTKDILGRPLSNKILYYIDGDDNIYPIGSIKMTSNGYVKEKVNCKYNYTVNTIPVGFISGNAEVSKIELNKTIQTIEIGAFNGTKIAEFVVSSDNPYFTTADEGKLLYTKDMSTLVAVAFAGENSSGFTINLPASVSKIRESALDLVTNVTVKPLNPLITYSSKDFNTTNNNKIIVPKEEVGYRYGLLSPVQSYVSNSSIGQSGKYVKPKEVTLLSKTAVQNLISDVASNSNINGGVCYIDLTECKAPAGASADFGNIELTGLNKNCLLFLPAGITASGTNIVIDGKCEKLYLCRDNGNPFETPYDFVADEVIVDGMTIKNSLMGVMFPFAFSGSVHANGNLTDVNTAFKTAIFYNYESENDQINLSVINGVAANVPFLIQTRNATDIITSLEFSEVSVKATEGKLNKSAVSNKWYMTGTYKPVTNSDAKYTLYGLSNNKIMKAAGATFKPFSSFFVNESASVSSAKIRLIDPFGLGESDETTGIDNETAGSVIVDNGSIIVTSNSNNKVSIISITGNVVADEIVSGTKSFAVESGVYIVNGKKVIVQ